MKYSSQMKIAALGRGVSIWSAARIYYVTAARCVLSRLDLFLHALSIIGITPELHHETEKEKNFSPLSAIKWNLGKVWIMLLSVQRFPLLAHSRR
jgi:hypothetical protein